MKKCKISCFPLDMIRIHIRIDIGRMAHESFRAVNNYEFRTRYWYQFENEVKGQLINFRWMDYEESEDVWLK